MPVPAAQLRPQEQEERAAGQRLRHRQHHQRGVGQVLVRQVQDHEDQHDHRREDEAQRVGRPNLVLELAAPLDVNALRQRHLLGHDALRLLDEADHVAAADVQRDVVHQLAVLAADRRRPLDDAHVGHLAQRHLHRPLVPAARSRGRAFRRRLRRRRPSPPPLTSRRLTDLLVLAVGAGVADAHREAVAVLDGLRDDPAAQRHLDRVLHVGHADAVAGRLLAVDLHFQVALAADLARPARPAPR